MFRFGSLGFATQPTLYKGQKIKPAAHATGLISIITKINLLEGQDPYVVVLLIFPFLSMTLCGLEIFQVSFCSSSARFAYWGSFSFTERFFNWSQLSYMEFKNVVDMTPNGVL
ncbi:hypothetical protein FU659_17965 [Paenibacillus sp. N3.4]|nr:hypothetical protein FU659_17965 [Paenibacillus sp. N3.4]